jgi:flagellar assembly protein FliH
MSSSEWEPLRMDNPESEGFVPWRGETTGSTSPRFHGLWSENAPGSEQRVSETSGLQKSPSEEARRILDEARTRAEHMEREAFEQGFTQGERAGREMAERSVESTLLALGAALESWQSTMETRSEEMVSEVVRMAMAVARKILQREVTLDGGVVADVVRGALAKGGLRGEVTVRVHPMDRGALLEARPEILRQLEEVRSLRVESDETIRRGGALVECEAGELDLRLERQFEEIELAFGRMLTERSA